MSWSTSGLRVGLAQWGRFRPSSKIFLQTVPGRCFFVDHWCVLCLVFLISRLFIAALWSFAWKRLTSRLLLMFFVLFVTFPCGILGQGWYLIVSFPDLCRLSYFYSIYMLNYYFYCKRSTRLLFYKMTLTCTCMHEVTKGQINGQFRL